MAAVLIAYACVGILAGILGGLLGIGGGVVSVPMLYFIFRFLGYPQTYLMHLAIGTSLAAMIFNTFASTWAHNKHKNVLWDVFKKLAPGLFLGSIGGAFIAKWLSGIILEIFFGCFLCLLAFYFWKNHPEQEASHRLPRTSFLFLWSGSIGAISNILGIGGGTLIVPFLTAFKVAAKKAIGTSAACSFLITTIGAVSYLILGWGKVSIPEGDIGYVDIPAFLVIGIISFLTAPLGARWTREFSVERLRKIFAFVLFFTGVTMIVG
ncbi:MAG TPA: sulfite exporter TauE/SafE family protein [Rhabdochlamydiaceae bacterium]|jgi:uncharacterized membrane protein YfcA